MAVLLLVFLVWTDPVLAHQYPDFDHSMGITIGNRSITLEYRLWFGPLLVPGLGLDRDRNGRISEEETYAFMEKMDRQIQNQLRLELDQTLCVPRFLTGTVSTAGSYPAASLDLALWYTIQAPLPRAAQSTLLIRDNNYTGYGPERKNLFIHTASRAGRVRVEQQGHAWYLTYMPDQNFALGSMGDDPLSGMTRPSAPPGQESRLAKFLGLDSPGPAMLLAALGTAFFLGAGHALSPGHGKAMVAAYLVGTRGRKRDAVILGGVVTLTHVISVIILGLVLLSLSTRLLPEKVYPWLSAASGLLIFLAGFFLLARQASTPHHSHGHGHTHTHPPCSQVPGLGSLVSLGVAGGMVPCPSAMVVLLASVSIGKIGLGLGLILAFSLGLALVLVSIGLAVVTVSGFSSSLARLEPLISRLPLAGALLVMLLGIALTAQALATAGVLKIMLP